MSKWNDVHIRQKIEISIEVLKKSYNFGSTIVRKNDSSVFFPMPASQQSATTIKKDMPCEITISLEQGSLHFNTQVDAIQPGKPPTVQINRPSDDKLNFRETESGGVKINVPITYRILRDPVTPISDTKKGNTISISPNDTTIHTVGLLKPGNYIELNITLPKDDVQVSLVGIIKDCLEVKSGAQVSHNSYIKYEIIRPGEQDKLVKFIFNQQRILRKKGLY